MHVKITVGIVQRVQDVLRAGWCFGACRPHAGASVSPVVGSGVTHSNILVL